MQLNETLTAIANQIHTEANELIAFASEDPLGGYHYTPSLQIFPPGSIWQVEGAILYALVRHLKPETIAEIGGWAGCSASHLAAAVKANGTGHVYSIDDGSEFHDFEHGHLIPQDLREYVTLIKDDGRIWLAKQEAQSIGLLFDDASHAANLIIELARLALQKVYPTGILVNHDAMHDQAYGGNGEVWPSGLGRQVRDALTNAGLYYTPYLTEPSDCGLAVTVVPGVKIVSGLPPVVSLSEHRRAEIELSDEQAEIISQVLNNHHIAQQVTGVNTINDRGVWPPQQIGNAHIESMSEPPQNIKPLPSDWQGDYISGGPSTDADFLNDDGNQYKEAEKKISGIGSSVEGMPFSDDKPNTNVPIERPKPFEADVANKKPRGRKPKAQ